MGFSVRVVWIALRLHIVHCVWRCRVHIDIGSKYCSVVPGGPITTCSTNSSIMSSGKKPACQILSIEPYSCSTKRIFLEPHHWPIYANVKCKGVRVSQVDRIQKSSHQRPSASADEFYAGNLGFLSMIYCEGVSHALSAFSRLIFPKILADVLQKLTERSGDKKQTAPSVSFGWAMLHLWCR